MGLRSPLLLAMLGVITGLLLAAALRWWPVLARRGTRGVLLRIAVLGGLQISVLALIFIWVNRSQQFYASWSDLLGTNAVSGHIRTATRGSAPSRSRSAATAARPLTTARGGRVAGGLSSAGLRPGRLPVGSLRPGSLPPGLLPPVPLHPGSLHRGSLHGSLHPGSLHGSLHPRSPHAGRYRSARFRPGRSRSEPPGSAGPGLGSPSIGRLRAVPFRGPVSGVSVGGYVVLPPGYSRRGPRLPVLVLIDSRLHSPRDAYGAGQVAATAAAGMAAHQLPGMLIVVLPPGVAGRSGHGCLDVPGGTQAGTFFTQDLPQVMRTSFRASLLPRQWAVAGGPGGGYCALQLATSAASPFSVAVAPAGRYLASPGRAAAPTHWFREQDSLAWRLRNWPQPSIRVLLTGPGGGDGLAVLARPPRAVTPTGRAPGAPPLEPVLAWVGQAIARR